MKYVFFLLLLLFSVNGWSACAPYSQGAFNEQTCRAIICVGQSPECPTVQNAVLTGNNANECQLNTESSDCRVVSNFTIRCDYIKCDTKCEGDSVACIRQGYQWNSANCECLGDDGCSELRADCESMGGTFRGTVVSDNGQTCCRSSCNVCGGGAMKSLYNAKSKICCENGQAPPDSNQTCQTVGMPTSGCGMVVSSYGDFTSGGWQCGDPSTSFEAAQRYRQQCFDGSSSSAPNSSGGSSGGSSGNQDCQECPYLEAILDTLTRQKHKVDDIYDCITRPGFCGEQQQKDSLTFPDWVETKMNKIIEFDSTNVQVTKSVDSVLKRVLVTDSAILNSDSLTRLAIIHGVDSLVNAIKNSSGGDSLGEYIDRIANLLGVQTSTLSHHLDSILNHIPNDILDSIYKYQKTSLDFFDTSFYVFGEGFGKIDNLTDSAIKYFRQGFHYDSVYSSVYRDSLGEIHEAINSLSTSIGYDMGYGDTATSTLRQDIGGIKSSIDQIGEMLGGVAVDTNVRDIWSSRIANGQRVGDSIANSYGWQDLKNLNVDSVYDHALLNYRNDSVGGVVDDSLNDLAVRLNDSLVRKTDSLKAHLSDSLNVWSDSLIVWAPFADFDSIIYSTLGTRIPNSDECPEDCQRWTLNLPIIGLYSYTVDFGLCLGRAPLGNLSVLAFLKLLLRLIVAYICVMVIYKTLMGII